MGDYKYHTFENDRLRTRGLHHHGFPLLLWDALVQTGYRDKSPEYCGQLYDEHDLQRYEVYVDIPSHPMFPDGSPWSTWAIGPSKVSLPKSYYSPYVGSHIPHHNNVVGHF
jgi:hypothetical protein